MDKAAAPRITILYDNTIHAPGMRADWGFACLVGTGGRRVLFDMGANGALLRANADTLGVTLDGLDAVVLSHEHWDHTGGLDAALVDNRGVAVHLVADSPRKLTDRITERGGRAVPVTGAREIVPGLWTTGQVGGRIPEQALGLETAAGLVVVTGCSHPGIVEMVRAASAARQGALLLALGGFHMMDRDAAQVDAVIVALRELGLARVAPSHCTGDAAIAAFHEAWGEDCLALGAGRVLEF
ncbi:MAG: MBL fold metallo-hydrolase [Candidatus Krumholzibacteriota bacterium]|nr:MBL fold metallo-hydrolase [Candidatus Krumholzibacteriota bacterium]